MRKSSIYLHSDNYIGKIICFLFVPFFTTIYCLKSAKSKSSQFIFFLFGLLFAWSMNYTNIDRGIDFIEIVRSFYMNPYISFQAIIDSYQNMFESGEIRNYQLIIFGIARYFSDNYHFMFFIASIPFSFFMIRSINLFFTNSKYTSNIICVILLVLFIMPKDFFSVQNFRYATATWMAVYAIIQILYENKTRYLLLLLFLPLVHTSFIFYLLVYIVYALLINIKFRTLLNLYFLTIPFAFLSTDLSSLFNFDILPSGLQKWISSYLSEESFKIYGNLNYMNGSGFFFITVIFTLVKTILYIYIPVFLIKKSSLHNFTDNQKSFLRFYIVYFALTNLVQFVPSLGIRNFDIIRILSIFIWYKLMFPKHNKYIYYLFASSMFELVFTTLKNFTMVLDIDFYFMNVFYLIYKHVGVSNFI